MQSEQFEKPKPAADPLFPTFVYLSLGKKQVGSVQAMAELIAETGVEWFDSPAKVPQQKAEPTIDWKAKFDASEQANADLRQVNADLVAKLMAKPEPKAPKADSK